MTIYLWVYFWDLYSVLFMYVSVFLPNLYCFNFVMYFEIREKNASSSGMLSQDCIGYLGSFVVSYKH